MTGRCPFFAVVGCTITLLGRRVFISARSCLLLVASALTVTCSVALSISGLSIIVTGISLLITAITEMSITVLLIITVIFCYRLIKAFDDLARDFLAGLDVIAVGADTFGVDVVPAEDPDKPFIGHVIYLKENGIYILETMNTGPLVRDGAFEFLFVLGQAKVRGAVQMIINPVAIR